MDLTLKKQKHLISFLLANFAQLFCGLLIVIEMNIISSDYLGIFIFQYTFFLVLGHLFTFGQHIYLLNKISLINNLDKKKKYIQKNLFSAVIPLLLGFSFLILITPFIDNSYFNKLGSNKFFLILSCLFFSLNKILLNIQNAFNYFYNLSLLIFLRSILLLTIITLILINNINLIDNLCYAFLITECSITVLYLSIFLIRRSNIKIKLNIYKKNINDGLKLFGDFFFSDLLLKIDILIIVYFFDFTKVSIYALTMVFVEGILTILVVLRNFFTSKFGYLIGRNKFKEYLKIRNRYGKFFFIITFCLVILGYIALKLLDKLLFNINNETYLFYFIILPSILIYSFYVNAEYIFSLKKRFFSQTKYFFKAILFQIAVLLIAFKTFSIYSFPLAISLMFVFMAINLYMELNKT